MYRRLQLYRYNGSGDVNVLIREKMVEGAKIFRKKVVCQHT